MICTPCKQRRHHLCAHRATCPCQHRKTVFNPAEGTLVPQSDRDYYLDPKNQDGQ